MNPPLEQRGDGSLTERYEQLRQHALGEPALMTGSLCGLEAFLQNGMAVWMRAVPRDRIQREEADTASVTSGWLATSPMETTLVLAEMTLPQLFQINRRS
jgi:hypothetical protein